MLDSIQGHDSFLVDYDRFIPAIADYMNQIG
jgi:homoserine acetyltransferase